MIMVVSFSTSFTMGSFYNITDINLRHILNVLPPFTVMCTLAYWSFLSWTYLAATL